MRRKDREMSSEFGMALIDNSSYGIISMIDEDKEAYGLPLSIAREGNTLYFHSARDGKKVNIFEKVPKVSIAFVGRVEVPENYTKDELDEIIKDPSKASLLISSVFTTEFESAIVTGHVKKVEDERERLNAMRIICEKFTPNMMKYFDMAAKIGLDRTNLYCVQIEEITAKRKKYDTKRQEMKWGRIE